MAHWCVCYWTRLQLATHRWMRKGPCLVSVVWRQLRNIPPLFWNAPPCPPYETERNKKILEWLQKNVWTQFKMYFYKGQWLFDTDVWGSANADQGFVYGLRGKFIKCKLLTMHNHWQLLNRTAYTWPTCDCLKTSLAMASRFPRSLMEETYSETALITTSQGGSTSWWART